MRIPDPIERMESNIERLSAQYDELQGYVLPGCFRCPCCGNMFDYQPIQVTGAPDSPVSCYECLPENAKRAYDEFQEYLADLEAQQVQQNGYEHDMQLQESEYWVDIPF